MADGSTIPMRDRLFLPMLAQRAERLRGDALRAECLAAAGPLAARLEASLARLRGDADHAPLLMVAMFGGTGVGKSSLFNALLGQEGASEVSDAERCFTRRPVVAVRPSERRLVRLPEELGLTFVDAAWRGLALTDAPDIDGALRENWQAARALVRAADVILYVTTPDRRADFEVHDELRRWALQKRWLFALNKADEVDAALPQVRDDFDLRLAEMGFVADDRVRFVVSATHADAFDLPRLRATLLDGRLAEQVERLRTDAALGSLQYATDDDVLEPLLRLAERIADEEQVLMARLRQVYREGFAQPVAEHAFRMVVREQTWQYVGERIGWLMALPLWIRRRVALISTTFHLSRMGLGGVNVAGLVGAAGSAVAAILRGTLPMRRILSALGPHFRQELTSIQAEGRRFLEDHGLADRVARSPAADPAMVASSPDRSDAAAPISATTVAPAMAAAGEIASATELARGRGTLAALDAMLQRLTVEPADRPLVEQLQTDVDHLAQRAAVRAGGPLTSFITNLLPTVMLGHILWRVGEAWWQHEYLPWPFYTMALGLFAASLAPGYVLIAMRVRRLADRPDADQLFANLGEPIALKELMAARRRLERLAAEAGRLREEAEVLRRDLGAGLPAAARSGLPRAAAEDDRSARGADQPSAAARAAAR